MERPIETFYQSDSVRIMRRHLFAILPAAVLALCCSPAAARWHCAASGRSEVCADGSGRRAAELLAELQALEAAWGAVEKPLPRSAPPLRVMVYRDRGEFEPFQSHPANLGLYQSGAERDWLMVLDQGAETLRAARHEWVHRALHHTTPRLPLWLEEGLAEVWSTLEVSPGRAILGKPPESRLRLLDRVNWLVPNEFWATSKSSSIYRDEFLASVFYAQAWAVAHALTFHPGWKGKLPDYISAIGSGMDSAEAFRLVWRKEPAEAVAAARSWAGRSQYGGVSIELPARLPAAEPQVRALDDTEAVLLRADALLANRQTSAAEALVDEVARRGKSHSHAAAARGFIALQRGDKPLALSYFEQAIQQGDKRGSILLERAMLLRETGAPLEKVRAALREAVEISPQLGEGWHLLSNLEASQGQTQLAIEAGEKAVALLPRQSIFWHSLGRAYLSAGRADEASAAAGKALQTAANSTERALAEGLVKAASSWQPPQPESASRPYSWFHVPDGWQGPKPDAAVGGRLVDVDCSASLLLFTIETAPRQRIILRASDPSRILLRQQGGEKREFVCGPQKPALLVDAGYHEQPDAKTRSAGVLVVLAIQGAEPPPPPPQPAKPKAPARPKPGRKS